MKHPEYDLQKTVCQYLEMQYPKVLFLSDTIASVKLTKQQAVRNKAIQKDGFKCPDLLILEPSKHGYCGLFIELKIKSPLKKNGEVYENKHLKGQEKTILELNKKGYLSMFCTGFVEAKVAIDFYLKDL